MRDRKLTNEELDQIGREVVRAGRVSEADIDNIVSSPMLFNSIKRRIGAEKLAQKTRAGFFGNLVGAFSFSDWSRPVAAFAIALTFLAGTVAVLVYTKQGKEPAAAPLAKIEQPAAAVQPQSALKREVETIAPAEEEEVTKTPQGVVQASYRKEPVRAQRPVQRRQAPRAMEAPVFEAEGAFHPVAGTPGTLPQDGQIVRTEIPRSSLVSMGVVDFPDGSNERVQADLLVGSDGVVRGVRIVRR